MKIKVYTSSNCPYCEMVKKFLKERNLKFKVINIDTDNKGVDFLLKNGFKGVPVTDIDGKLIFGFDTEKLQAALG